MGQRASELEHRPAAYGGTTGGMSGTHETAADGASSAEQSPYEIRSEIEQTRAEMTETIDEIQERLSPAHLKEQAWEQAHSMYQDARDSVREATVERAKGAGSTMWETIRENPIPATMAALGVGWLVMKGSSGSSSHHPSYQGGRYYRTYETYEPRGSTAGQMQERASHMAGQAREKAGQVSQEAREQASHYADEAQHQLHAASDRFEQMLHENPLAVGAAALALGTAIGMSLPETQTENQFMGETRDRLVEKAKETAKESATDTAMEKAKEAMHRVEQAL